MRLFLVLSRRLFTRFVRGWDSGAWTMPAQSSSMVLARRPSPGVSFCMLFEVMGFFLRAAARVEDDLLWGLKRSRAWCCVARLLIYKVKGLAASCDGVDGGRTGGEKRA